MVDLQIKDLQDKEQVKMKSCIAPARESKSVQASTIRDSLSIREILVCFVVAEDITEDEASTIWLELVKDGEAI
jgi:hypothetical protein